MARVMPAVMYFFTLHVHCVRIHSRFFRFQQEHTCFVMNDVYHLLLVVGKLSGGYHEANCVHLGLSSSKVHTKITLLVKSQRIVGVGPLIMLVYVCTSYTCYTCIVLQSSQQQYVVTVRGFSSRVNRAPDCCSCVLPTITRTMI